VIGFDMVVSVLVHVYTIKPCY